MENKIRTAIDNAGGIGKVFVELYKKNPDIKYQTVQNWFYQKSYPRTAEARKQLAEVLGVDPLYLVEEC
jgi:hypothetical protein